MPAAEAKIGGKSGRNSTHMDEGKNTIAVQHYLGS
jgi:hypothetical protein